MNKDEHERILDEIVALSDVPVAGPGDITAAEYAQRTRISREGARGRLSRMEQAGILVSSVKMDPESRVRIRCWRLKDPLDSGE